MLQDSTNSCNLPPSHPSTASMNSLFPSHYSKPSKKLLLHQDALASKNGISSHQNSSKSISLNNFSYHTLKPSQNKENCEHPKKTHQTGQDVLALEKKLLSRFEPLKKDDTPLSSLQEMIKLNKQILEDSKKQMLEVSKKKKLTPPAPFLPEYKKKAFAQVSHLYDHFCQKLQQEKNNQMLAQKRRSSSRTLFSYQNKKYFFSFSALIIISS